MVDLTNNKVKTMKITKSKSRKKQKRSLRSNHQCNRSWGERDWSSQKQGRKELQGVAYRNKGHRELALKIHNDSKDTTALGKQQSFLTPVREVSGRWQKQKPDCSGWGQGEGWGSGSRCKGPLFPGAGWQFSQASLTLKFSDLRVRLCCNKTMSITGLSS